MSRYEFAQIHMGVECRITLYAVGRECAANAAAQAFERIASLDASLSDWLRGSELNRLSDAAGGPAVIVSEDLYRVMDLARQLSEATDGAFDPTVGPVVRLWRQARRDGRLPNTEELASALLAVGWKEIELNPEDRTVRLVQPGMRLDLGGIGKGFAADRAGDALREQGVNRFLIDLGGDLLAGEPPPGREGWAIQVRTGLSGGTTVEVENAGVATSGDTAQFVEIGGIRYSHIVDPRTGLGVTNRIAATVIAPDAATADALASAVCVLGEGRGREVVAGFEGASVIVEVAR
ncbi:MAG: FAD:protein FMN transferase [Phycisphaeraceae bacterium]|nr:FAD:protein FMN transferase [Phycisphaeraceae bacterium]